MIKEENLKRLDFLIAKYNLPVSGLNNKEYILAEIAKKHDPDFKGYKDLGEFQPKFTVHYASDKNRLIIKSNNNTKATTFVIDMEKEPFPILSLSTNWQFNRDTVGTGPRNGSILTIPELDQIMKWFHETKISNIKRTLADIFINKIADKRSLLIKKTIIDIVSELPGDPDRYASMLKQIFKDEKILSNSTQSEVLEFKQDIDLLKIIKEFKNNHLWKDYYQELDSVVIEKFGECFQDLIQTYYINSSLYINLIKNLGIEDNKTYMIRIPNKKIKTGTLKNYLENLYPLGIQNHQQGIHQLLGQIFSQTSEEKLTDLEKIVGLVSVDKILTAEQTNILTIIPDTLEPENILSENTEALNIYDSVRKNYPELGQVLIIDSKQIPGFQPAI